MRQPQSEAHLTFESLKFRYVLSFLCMILVWSVENSILQRGFFFFFFWSFCLLGLQSQHMEVSRLGAIGTVANSLLQSHSNTGSKQHLRPTPHLMATLEAKDRTHVLMDASQVC